MPDFSRPEYASYVQLCRGLQLAHRLQEGDWVGYETDANGGQAAGLVGLMPAIGRRDWWLPSLADWFEVLEAVEVVGTARDYYIRIALAAFDDIYIVSAVWPSESLDGEGPTREEAIARLYQVVRG